MIENLASGIHVFRHGKVLLGARHALRSADNRGMQGKILAFPATDHRLGFAVDGALARCKSVPLHESTAACAASQIGGVS
jgi:hypothetical protein